MGDYKTLLLEKHDAVAVVTLNMPEKRNALTADLTREFPQVIQEVRQDSDIRALVITGAGPAFCAGGDLAMLERMLDQPPDQNRREMGEFYRAYLCILNVDVPTIAALNGDAIGAGISFSLGCDVRLAAENARFGFTYLNLGLHPGMATTHLLPPIVGSANAADLMFTGRLIRASEALAMGLVSKVVPGEQLMQEALSLAGQIAAKSPSGVRMAKRALVKPKLDGLEAALDYEATAQMTSYASSEMRQALDAFKRR